jgi:hypothetical protein
LHIEKGSEGIGFEKNVPRTSGKAGSENMDGIDSGQGSNNEGEGGKDDSTLREKIKGRIRLSLRQTWSEFSSGMDSETVEYIEERAYAWMTLGREVVFDTNGSLSLTNDDKQTRARAKLEVLKEMYILLGEEEGDDGFWRLVEGVVAIPQGLTAPGMGERRDSDLYWE